MTSTPCCFAQVSSRCRAAGGSNAAASRWHAVSSHERFCQDCVDHYGRGEGRRAWQAEQEAHGKCSFKEVVVRLHLPVWAQCALCSKWRALPPRTQPSALPEGWHCGLLADAEGSAGASTRRGTHRPGACAASSSRHWQRERC